MSASGGDRGSRSRLAMLCSPYHRGGIERWMVDLAVAWGRAGHEGWFVTPRPRAPFRSAGPCDTVASLLGACGGLRGGLHVSMPDVGPEFEFGTERYRASVYAAAACEVPPDVPIITSDDPAAWRAGAWLAGRNPLVLVVHGDYEGYYERVRRYAPRAAAVVAISERIRARIRRDLGSDGPLVERIPLGIELGPEPPERVGAVGEPARLIWVGRMDEESKRVSDLARIGSALHALGVPFVMDLVGDGEARRPLEQAVASSPNRDAFRFLGWRAPSEVGSLLSEADVLLLPSNREGLPMVVLEALARGCAVIASRVSGVEDYEHHPLAHDCLRLHGVGDVRDAADLVARSLDVPAARRVQAARQLAHAEFSIDRCADRYAVALADLPARSDQAYGHSRTRDLVIRLASRPVAAQRRLRLWAGRA